ncbi:hypothetical protein G7Y89_g13122 [Cudoniella acicularis]|uniref:Uncharacterized protein n=1 Tax=Cudoniella acicularis TaxID=354080 RepID=A0A8H4VWC7_9HELO|nr:hypothetical protein G7Y89_g13122 [Cudoniella acicularis]
MIISAIPSILQAGTAIGPFALSLYMLGDGSKAIVDPEATSESVMLWFYLLIHIGGFFEVATSYTAKYIGFWVSFLLPGIVYFILPTLLVFINKRLKKLPPRGSALGNFVKVNLLALRKARICGFGRKGY